ncbi:MAG: GxxExxY protein [Gemmatimonas sp.]|nr:GxxExxY protein [Gemmatimonas sp.]
MLEAVTTRKIIGAFYHVYNQLGYGFAESVYQRALARVLERTGSQVSREWLVRVVFEDEVVGEFRLDLVVEARVVVEIKAVEHFHPAHESQLLNYLRASGLEVGLLLNFGPRAAYRRLVVTRSADLGYAALRNSG